MILQVHKMASFGNTRHYMRKHATVLFGTPHIPLGLADWAFLSARQLGVPGLSSSRLTQDWSPYTTAIKRIMTVQDDFRNMIRPEMQILHGSTPIAIHGDHYSMTRLGPGADGELRMLVAVIKEWLGDGLTVNTLPQTNPRTLSPTLQDVFNKAYRTRHGVFTVMAREATSQGLVCVSVT
ncbi:hypothetical protein GGR54DRAFT_649749 [Hypoxylon sp. NC1633]|nr:hypothetical protein GGR54DRAFT_649749 [Hypoxylon sp. NC1633]